jgi:OOP family OmpA-OmpF porin
MGDNVNGTTKFIIGGVVTSLMAMATHSLGGYGQRFLDKLTDNAQTALGEAGSSGGVTLAFENEPALHRIAVLSGNADQATKDRLLAAVRAVPGVAGARWADDGSAVAEAPASAAEVVACQTQVDGAIAGKTIQFQSGSAVISAESTALIDALAATLGPCDGMTIEVAGHTDASGNPASNQTLSQARADAVITALSAKGVPAARMVGHGYGSAQPKVAGRGGAADAANRRIEFKVASSSDAAAAPAAPAAAAPTSAAPAAAATPAGGQ